MRNKLLAVVLVCCLSTSALAAAPPPPNNDPWYSPIMYWVVSQWSQPNCGSSFWALPDIVQQMLRNLWHNWAGGYDYYLTAPEI